MTHKIDEQLAHQYGAYASFQTETAPAWVEYYGENPANEISRLLDIYIQSDSRVLDLGCGAGQTTCQIAPKAREVWGIDLNIELLNGARQRVKTLGLTNVTLVEGDTTLAEAVEQLPDDHFDLAFSQRGPNMSRMLVGKLKKEGMFLQELVSNFDGYPLKEIFGRRHYAAYEYADQQVIMSSYAEIDLFPISLKEYFYEEFYRDINHLEAYLTQGGANLSNWRLPDKPYEAGRDRPALELYTRYNTTSKGIRLLRQRKIFALRRAPVTYYPVDGLS
jgi:SAM-dependent methyltransferase